MTATDAFRNQLFVPPA